MLYCKTNGVIDSIGVMQKLRQLDNIPDQQERIRQKEQLMQILKNQR